MGQQNKSLRNQTKSWTWARQPPGAIFPVFEPPTSWNWWANFQEPPIISYMINKNCQYLPVRTRQDLVVFPTTFFAENPVRFLRAALDSRPRKRHGFVSAVTLRSCKQTSYVAGFIMAWRSQIPIDQWTNVCLKGFPMELPLKKRRFVDRKLVQVNDDAASHVWITEGRNQPDHTTEISTVLYTIHLCDTFYSTRVWWCVVEYAEICSSVCPSVCHCLSINLMVNQSILNSRCTYVCIWYCFHTLFC